jgi:transposase-like protein
LAQEHPAHGALQRAVADAVQEGRRRGCGTIYTTNVIEALHRSLRKIIKTRGSFPNEAAPKLL